MGICFIQKMFWCWLTVKFCWSHPHDDDGHWQTCRLQENGDVVMWQGRKKCAAVVVDGLIAGNWEMDDLITAYPVIHLLGHLRAQFCSRLCLFFYHSLPQLSEIDHCPHGQTNKPLGKTNNLTAAVHGFLLLLLLAAFWPDCDRGRPLGELHAVKVWGWPGTRE